MLLRDVLILLVPVALVAVLTHRSSGPAAGLLGLLMPLTSVPGVPYNVIVVARFALCIVILMRWPADQPTPAIRQARQILVLIGILGLLVGGFSVSRADHSTTSVALTMIESVIVAWILSGRSSVTTNLATGFVIGASASAVFSVYQWTHHIHGGDALVARYVGLSSSSTRIAYEYAIAFLIVALSAPRGAGSSIFVRGGLMALLLAALAASGGRGGLLALGLGLVVVSKAVGRTAQRARGTLIVFIIVAVVVLEARGNISVVDRILGPAGTYRGANVGLSNGRSSLWRGALTVLGDHPLSGLGIDAFITRYGDTPHAAPIFFGVAAGGIGFILALILVFQVWRLSLSTLATRTRATSIATGILAVLAVRSVLEPTAPLVGMEEVSLFAIMVRLIYEGRQADPNNAQEQEVRPEVVAA